MFLRLLLSAANVLDAAVFGASAVFAEVCRRTVRLDATRFYFRTLYVLFMFDDCGQRNTHKLKRVRRRTLRVEPTSSSAAECECHSCLVGARTRCEQRKRSSVRQRLDVSAHTRERQQTLSLCAASRSWIRCKYKRASACAAAPLWRSRRLATLFSLPPPIRSHNEASCVFIAKAAAASSQFPHFARRKSTSHKSPIQCAGRQSTWLARPAAAANSHSSVSSVQCQIDRQTFSSSRIL